MAVIASVPPVYASGEGKRFAVFRLTGVQSGDTFSVGAEFSRVDVATAYSPSSMAATAITIAVVGRICTITGADLDDDVVYLSVGGSAAT